jgi:creatinine amidohydrolase
MPPGQLTAADCRDYWEGCDLVTHLLAELTRDEAGRLVPDATVILPSAAIEQHGPHLPIITDTCIVGAVSERVAAAASVPVLVAPTVCYGASQHHFPFPGVMSLSSSTFSATLRDLLDSLARMGARRVYLLNGHGGNDELIRLVAREEGFAKHLAIGAASYWSIAWDGLLGIEAHSKLGTLPGHAGHFETALMMALRPDLVHGDAIPVPMENQMVGDVWPGGMRGTITPPHNSLGTSGTSDDAGNATAEWGERLLDVCVREVAAAIEDFHQTAGAWFV